MLREELQEMVKVNKEVVKELFFKQVTEAMRENAGQGYTNINARINRRQDYGYVTKEAIEYTMKELYRQQITLPRKFIPSPRDLAYKDDVVFLDSSHIYDGFISEEAVHIEGSWK